MLDSSVIFFLHLRLQNNEKGQNIVKILTKVTGRESLLPCKTAHLFPSYRRHLNPTLNRGGSRRPRKREPKKLWRECKRFSLVLCLFPFWPRSIFARPNNEKRTTTRLIRFSTQAKDALRRFLNTKEQQTVNKETNQWFTRATNAHLFDLLLKHEDTLCYFTEQLQILAKQTQKSKANIIAWGIHSN